MTKLEDITQLTITDFRSIAGTSVIPLDAPIVLIHGPNGSGKTSILSALELALTGDVVAMRRDDANFLRHLVHEGAAQAKVSVVGAAGEADSSGSYVIANGICTGTPYLDGRDRKFFGERCYLAQTMLGRLLDIYQNSKVEVGGSALTQFVKDLLGLDQLDALVDGLHDAGHKSRTKTLVPEYRSFETRIERATTENTQLTQELSNLDASRAVAFAGLSEAFAALFPDEPIAGLPVSVVGERLRSLSTDSALLDAMRRQTELRSMATAWSALPKDADSNERSSVEAAELAARTAAEEWRQTTGVQLEELIVGLRGSFPDLASWSSTDPASAIEAADRRVSSELIRLKALLDKEAASEKREGELSDQISKEDARSQLIDSQIAGLASNAGDYASVLAALVPHVHTDDCPVCGRNFGEVSKEPLAQHLQKTIAKLTEDAGRLSGLSAEKSASTARLAQLRRELATVHSQRMASETKAGAARLQATMSESKVAIDRLKAAANSGSNVLGQEAALRGRLTSFRDRDRGASDLRGTISVIAAALGRADLGSESFETILGSLQGDVGALVTRLEGEQRRRNAALLSFQSIGQSDQRRRIVAGDLEKGKEALAIMKGAVAELEKLKGQAKTIGETAQDARTAIVRRVFNDSLNKLWRDLFVRLAPTEPFVPAFKIPESDSNDFAKLETVHRSGRKAGTPGAMLSSGNLNTAALTLFLALHFSVGSRLPWLVLDDPVQNMDEVHVAQFAALLRTLSRAHGTKVVIAVHERPLFDYLRLELSPAFEKDRLLTLELRRTAGEPTRIVSDIVTYEVDAVAA